MPKRRLEEGANDADAMRARLRAAAVRCVLRYGVRKTGVADLAKEAGCSRQTVYNHYADADAVIQAALFEAALGFAARTIETVRAESTAEARVVEAMIFVLSRLPHEPFLRLVADPELSGLVSGSMFAREESRALVEGIARVCLEPVPRLAARAPELAEVMTRLVLSFLVLGDARPRNEDEMRGFLRRWLLPGLLTPDPGEDG